MDGDTKKKQKYRSPAFNRNLYNMVDDPSTDSIISWGESGKSFIVWNESEFCRDVLPLHTPYHDMSGFLGRLQSLGFKKIEESQHWEYASDDLVRGHPEPKLTLEEMRPTLDAFLKKLNRRLGTSYGLDL